MLYTEFYEITVFNIAEGYFINKCGQIISLRDRGIFRMKSLGIDGDGYHGTKLVCKDGITRFFRVNRLVCAQFNSLPIDNQICMHKDNNKLNNIPTNLKWGSVQENTIDAYKDGLCSISKKIICLDVTTNQVIEFYSAQEFGRYLGCSNGYANQLLTKKYRNPQFKSNKFPKANDLQIIKIN